jgi:hypothetical protein
VSRLVGLSSAELGAKDKLFFYTCKVFFYFLKNNPQKLVRCAGYGCLG